MKSATYVFFGIVALLGGSALIQWEFGTPNTSKLATSRPVSPTVSAGVCLDRSEEQDEVILNKVTNAIPSIVTADSDNALDRVDAEIECVRGWSRQLTDPCVRDSYGRWLDSEGRRSAERRKELREGHTEDRWELEQRQKDARIRAYAATHPIPTPPGISSIATAIKPESEAVCSVKSSGHSDDELLLLPYASGGESVSTVHLLQIDGKQPTPRDRDEHGVPLRLRWATILIEHVECVAQESARRSA